jgi:hypothetical protein
MLFVDIACAQIVLTNGANQAGTLLANTTNSYTLTANTGDSIVLRLGSSFNAKLQLKGPTGAFLGLAQDSPDNLIAYTATNSGTFTVLVSSFGAGGTGTYVLHLAQIPEAFIVPAGDEGGALTNGGNFAGTIDLGDLDMWTFTANTGDTINLRLGSSLNAKLQLYGPNGALLGIAQDSVDNLIAYTATNSGTFTVLVSSFGLGGTGTYVLHLAQIPEAFIVPAGDEGGALTNGGNFAGTIDLGDLDMWTFTATTGDTINLRLGSSLNAKLQLYGPNGALLGLAQDSPDNLIAYTATNSGTFTVLVSSFGLGGTGTYVLHLAQIPKAFIVPAGDEGGPMTNGGNFAGTIDLGDLDMWTFTANTGDTINLRLGSSLNAKLQLYGPNGALLGLAQDSPDNLIAYTATNSGTFTVLVSSFGLGGTGTYVLHLAQIPEAFIVPAGDEGGALTNGGNFTGTNTLGDLDLWTFTANTGDAINLRLGTSGFNGKLQLYGPTGALLGLAQDSPDNLIAYTATNSGTFTVLVSSFGAGGTGTYVLYLAQFPEAFIVPPGDEGGGMTGSGSYVGTIELGDEDPWAFTACKGDVIRLGLNTTNFNGKLQLYGPNGALLATAQDSTALSITYGATNCGTFTVLVSSFGLGGTGTYGLTANELSDEFKICRPIILGSSITVNGVGVVSNTVAVLYSTTNLDTHFALWSPINTNRFDSFRVFTYTNVYNPSQLQQYFRLFLP